MNRENHTETKVLLALVEDEPDLRQALGLALRPYGFQIIEFADANQAWEFVQKEKGPQPDVWMIDIMLPGLWDGLDLVRSMRELPQYKDTPILVLTARGHESDVVRGFEWGADDYVVKPYRTRELVARIRTLLKRSSRRVGEKEKKDVIPDGLSWDSERRILFMNGQPLILTARETEIFELLVNNSWRYFTREEIYQRLWSDEEVTPRTVDVHIRNLRKKLGPYYRFLVTQRGLGYRWEPSDDKEL